MSKIVEVAKKVTAAPVKAVAKSVVTNTPIVASWFSEGIKAPINHPITLAIVFAACYGGYYLGNDTASHGVALLQKQLTNEQLQIAALKAKPASTCDQTTATPAAAAPPAASPAPATKPPTHTKKPPSKFLGLF